MVHSSLAMRAVSQQIEHYIIHTLHRRRIGGWSMGIGRQKGEGGCVYVM